MSTYASAQGATGAPHRHAIGGRMFRAHPMTLLLLIVVLIGGKVMMGCGESDVSNFDVSGPHGAGGSLGTPTIGPPSGLGTLPPGASCVHPSDCSSATCVGGSCSSCLSDGQSCSSNDRCCSHSC